MASQLFVYGDESGVHGSPYFILAGMIGSLRQWKYFESTWRSVLKEFGVDSFHATEYFGRRHKKASKTNPYRDWSREKERRFLRRLLAVIKQRQIYPICLALDVKGFQELSEDCQHWLTFGQFRKDGCVKKHGARRPYQCLLSHFVTKACLEASEGTTVHFTFDYNEQEIAHSKDVFKQLRDAGFTSLGSLQFADDRMEPPLQAADLLSHAWYGALHGKAPRKSERAYAMNELTKRRNQVEIYDKAYMERLCDHPQTPISAKRETSSDCLLLINRDFFLRYGNQSSSRLLESLEWGFLLRRLNHFSAFFLSWRSPLAYLRWRRIRADQLLVSQSLASDGLCCLREMA